MGRLRQIAISERGLARRASAAPSPRNAAPSGAMASVATASGAISQTGQRLLSVAQDVLADGHADPRAGQAPILSEFIQIYREWISTHRGRPGTQAQQAEQWQLVLYAMVAAADIGSAIGFLIRFGKVVWGERGPVDLRIEGQSAVLVFSEPFRPGPEGLIAAIWHLALTLCELEFLANASFTGASGRVPHPSCLPDSVARLLFGRVIAYDAGEVALVIPRHHLRRPVTARPADLPQFFKQLLPLTLGAARDSPSPAAMAEGLLRDDKRGPAYRASSLENVATRLGMSPSTLRRRLAAEGTSYSAVRERIYNALAQDWLRQPELAIEAIAARLDFSDSFSFRRFFRRLNGISPSAFRARDGDQSAGTGRAR